jgi:hypothetical protein
VALRRVLRIQGEVGRAHFEHGQDGGQQIEAAAVQEPHDRAWAGALRGQVRGEPPRARRQLRIGDPAVAADGGEGAGHPLHQRGEAIEEDRRRRGGGGVVVLQDNGVPLGRGKERQLGERQVRRTDDPLEQGQEVAGEARRRARLEQPHIEGEPAGEPLARLAQVELQIIARGPLQHLVASQLKIARHHRRRGDVLEGEHHLIHRVAAHVALDPQLLHQALERQVLMGEGAESPLADAAEQLAEAAAGREIPSHHQSVEQQADQPLQRDPVTVGHRDTDQYRLLAGVAEKQRVEGRHQRHVEAGLVADAQGTQRPGQARADRHIGLVAAEGLLRLARQVGEQLEDERRAGELFLPEGEEAAQALALQQALLPGREIGILDRQRGERRGLAGGAGVVQRHHVAEEDADRPDVADGMVHDQEEDGLLVSQPEQVSARQWVLPEVERLADGAGDQPSHLALTTGLRNPAQVGLDQAQLRFRREDRHSLATQHLDAQAQGFVPAADPVQAALQDREVEPAADAHRAGHVVSRAPRLELLDEPQASLPKGEGRGLALAPPGDRGRGLGRSRLPLLLLHQLHQTELLFQQFLGAGQINHRLPRQPPRAFPIS